MWEVVIWSVLLPLPMPVLVLAIRSQAALREARREEARVNARVAAARPRLALVKPGRPS